MHKFFYSFFVIAMMSGYLFCTTSPDEPKDVALISNLNLNIKCNPEQEISGIHQEVHSTIATIQQRVKQEPSKDTVIQKSSNDQMDVNIQEERNGVSLKVKVAIAATAVAGFCYTNAETVVDLAAKIKRMVK